LGLRVGAIPITAVLAERGRKANADVTDRDFERVLIELQGRKA